MQILVVDEKVIAYTIEMYLRKKTHIKVDFATELSGAFIKLFEKHYDMIILDNSLPEVRGIDAIIPIKKQWPEIKLVMFTVDAFCPEFREEVLARGADKVFSKPGGVEGLFDYIKEMAGEE